jgi:uncharacterized protein YecE (DUF72 family)
MSAPRREPAGGRILIGTASWTDKSLIDCGRFYPAEAKTPEARLQYYATRFPLVEVDSTYYAMPAERTAALWVERTPEDFVFDIKSYALFTHHPTPPRSLPKDVREALSPELFGKKHLYYQDLPSEVRLELWDRFASALLPLERAGKLGTILFQFPPWFLPGHESRGFIGNLRERLPQYTPSVEFRNPLWLDEQHRDRTLGLLRDLRLPFVCVDEPQGTRASVPPIVAATADVSVVRFHGRNAKAWAARNVGVAEKYDYEYSAGELREWLPGVRELASETREVHVLMNNCVEDKAVKNADMLGRMLDLFPAPVPAAPPPQPRLL